MIFILLFFIILNFYEIKKQKLKRAHSKGEMLARLLLNYRENKIENY